MHITTRRLGATHFSLSTSVKDIFGITFTAISSISKQSIVAMNAMSPATRAWTKVSLRARENAGTKTFRLVLYPKEGPKRPIRIHVLVLIEGSGSICNLANRRKRSLFSKRSLNWMNVQQNFRMTSVNLLTLGASKMTDLMVASLMTATVSEKPVCYWKNEIGRGYDVVDSLTHKIGKDFVRNHLFVQLVHILWKMLEESHTGATIRAWI